MLSLSTFLYYQPTLSLSTAHSYSHYPTTPPPRRVHPDSPPPASAPPLDNSQNPLPFSSAHTTPMLSIPAPYSPPVTDILPLDPIETKPPLPSLVPPADSSQATKSAVSLTPFELFQLLEGQDAVVVIDTRCLEAFLGEQGRIKYSINVGFPSLLCKRFSKRIGTWIEIFKLEDFVTTELGKHLYKDNVNPGRGGIEEGRRQVVVIDDKMHERKGAGEGCETNPGRVLLSILEAKLQGESGKKGTGLFYLDRALGEAAKGEERLRKWVVWGENDQERTTPPRRSRLPALPTTVASRLPPISIPRSPLTSPRSASLPPSTILSPRQSSNNIPLRLDTLPTPAPGRSNAARANLCKLDTSSSLLAPHSRPGVSSATVMSSIPSPVMGRGSVADVGAGGIARKAVPPRLNLESLKISNDPAVEPGGGGGGVGQTTATPTRKMSLHEMCHFQAKSPPAQAIRFQEAELTLPPQPSSLSSRQHSNLASPLPLSPGGGGGGDLPPRFEPSMIIDGFLYLGQEPSSPGDFEQLEMLGITEILNSALECTPPTNCPFQSRPLLSPNDLKPNQSEEEEDSSTKFIQKYWYLPLRDSIEESGVAEVLDKSCRILDDAKLRDKKVYVHCKAGLSRSVSIVIGYFIHSHRWTLKRAYGYVAERREKISPNLGFMAELMSFEERLHSNKSSTIPSSSLHRSKSASVHLDHSSNLLLMSPTTSPSKPRPSPPSRQPNKGKLERGCSDLGPSGSTKGVNGTSRAVREILSDEREEREGEARGGWEGRGRGTNDQNQIDARAREQGIVSVA
ncbi:hypothetical protein JCM16303_002843 [Sporobolomyces ruberrimus]